MIVVVEDLFAKLLLKGCIFWTQVASRVQKQLVIEPLLPLCLHVCLTHWLYPRFHLRSGQAIGMEHIISLSWHKFIQLTFVFSCQLWSWLKLVHSRVHIEQASQSLALVRSLKSCMLNSSAERAHLHHISVGRLHLIDSLCGSRGFVGSGHDFLPIVHIDTHKLFELFWIGQIGVAFDQWLTALSNFWLCWFIDGIFFVKYDCSSSQRRMLMISHRSGNLCH